jgi:hypothetical protein
LAERESRFGRLKRRCQAAVTGQVIAIRHGAVMVEAEASTLELHSPFAGRITDIVPAQGVLISAAGALIQGLWGCGSETSGILRVVVGDRDEALTAESLETDSIDDGPNHSSASRCQILAVGGNIMDEAALEKAVEVQIGGLIVGSVSAGLRPQLQALPCPVLMTEGFGELAMRSEAFTLLKASHGRSATMTAACPPTWPGGPPNVFVPTKPVQAVAPKHPTPQPLQVGMRVRGLRAPYQGLVGTVHELPDLPQIVDSGIRLPVATVALDGGENAVIPCVNLEALR